LGVAVERRQGVAQLVANEGDKLILCPQGLALPRDLVVEHGHPQARANRKRGGDERARRIAQTDLLPPLGRWGWRCVAQAERLVGGVREREAPIREPERDGRRQRLQGRPDALRLAAEGLALLGPRLGLGQAGGGRPAPGRPPRWYPPRQGPPRRGARPPRPRARRPARRWNRTRYRPAPASPTPRRPRGRPRRAPARGRPAPRWR